MEAVGDELLGRAGAVDAVGDDEGEGVVAGGGQETAMAGNALLLDLLASVYCHIWKVSAQDLTRARPGTASALAALSRQTPPGSSTQVLPSQPSTSSPPCEPSWRTWRRLKFTSQQTKCVLHQHPLS